VLCFLKPPSESVRRFLDLPNVSIEIIEDSWQLSAKATARLFAVLRTYRPRIDATQARELRVDSGYVLDARCDGYGL
jgi:hypothetical protein